VTPIPIASPSTRRTSGKRKSRETREKILQRLLGEMAMPNRRANRRYLYSQIMHSHFGLVAFVLTFTSATVERQSLASGCNALSKHNLTLVCILGVAWGSRNERSGKDSEVERADLAEDRRRFPARYCFIGFFFWFVQRCNIKFFFCNFFVTFGKLFIELSQKSRKKGGDIHFFLLFNTHSSSFLSSFAVSVEKDGKSIKRNFRVLLMK
jgi:hypothetical protein